MNTEGKLLMKLKSRNSKNLSDINELPEINEGNLSEVLKLKQLLLKREKDLQWHRTALEEALKCSSIGTKNVDDNWQNSQNKLNAKQIEILKKWEDIVLASIGTKSRKKIDSKYQFINIADEYSEFYTECSKKLIKSGYKCAKSVDLSTIPFVQYLFKNENKKIDTLYVMFDFPCETVLGEVGIEIVSVEGNIIYNKVTPASALKSGEPVKFFLIDDNNKYIKFCEGDWWIRIFVRNIKLPIHVIELIKTDRLGRKKADHILLGY